MIRQPLFCGCFVKNRKAIALRFFVCVSRSINDYITESEIAATLAFSSQAYFQTVFKKETGQMPGEYRSTHAVDIKRA